MALHVGTSGWSYPIWKPAFFPEKLPQKRFLEFYSTQLNAVELNATFRRFSSASSIQNWVAGTPADFRFAAKAHQIITHFRRLKDAEAPLRSYLESLEPMRQSGKLGPILFQTPPNLQADSALLEAFVQLLPQAYQFAFEFRHESWFSDATFEVLKSRKNAALCWAQSEKISTPKIATADFVYYRFRLPEYSKDQLNKIAEELAAQPQKEIFAFFKHEENPESALNATYVARLLGIEEKSFVLETLKKAKKV